MTNKSYDLVQASESDIDRLKPLWGELLIHHHNVAPDFSALGRPLTLEESWPLRREQYLNWFSQAEGHLWVAARDDTILAYCFVHLAEGNNSWDWGSRTGILESLIVTESARGAGLGRRLFTLAQQHFAQKDVHIAKVSALASNEGALRLYRRLGFTDQILTLIRPVKSTPGQ